jgi:hypothetical protein
MDPNKQQLMREMIERAAQDQEKNLEWVGDLYRQRLKNLRQSKEHNENTDELA